MNFRRAFFWLDDLSTGITFLDDELQGLFERFLDLIDEMERQPELSRFADGMETIAHDIQVHFLHEEHVMRKIEYPHYGAHRAEHQRLVEGLSEFVDNLGVGFSEEHLPAVTHYFAKWLMSHVKEHDVKIKQYLDEPVRQPQSVPRTPRRTKNPHVAEVQTASFERRRSA